MANKLRDEDLQLNIIVNGDKGKKELGDLEKSTRDLTNRNKELRAEKEKLIRAGKQETAEFKKVTAEMAANNKAIKSNEARMTELRQEIGITGLTMRQLRSEQTRLKRLMDSSTPGTAQWKQYRLELDKVEAQIKKVSTGAKTTHFSIGKMADGFNRYFSMLTVWAASLTGMIFGLKKAANLFAEFDDKVADVQKTTGLTRDEVIGLDKELQKIDTRTAQEDLLGLARIAGKLGKDNVEDIEGFVRAADKINVALNEDLGGDIEETVRKLGKLTQIFNLEEQFGTEQALLKVGSTINALGAASTANEGYLVEFTSRMAGLAPAAGISAPQVLGLASTLDQLAQTSEISATTFAQVIPNMFKDTATFASVANMSVADFTTLLETDANEALVRLLEGLNGNNDGMAEMIRKLDSLGVDGTRGTNVLLRLAKSTDTLREQQALANIEFEKGTSLTEEFNIKNNTRQAQLEKARKNISLITRELGENLSPAILVSTNALTYFIKAMVQIIRITKQYYPIIISSAAAIAAYTIALKLNTAEKRLALMTSKLGLAAERAYITVKALLTGQIKIATIAQRAWNVAVKANPIGAALAVIIAVGAAIWQYSKHVNQATAAKKLLNDVETEAAKNIAEQKTNVELLLQAAKNEKRSLDERKAALAELNRISPKYFGNLTLEKINTQEATTATENYTKALLKQARVQAAKEKLVEIDKELIDIQSGENTDPTVWQKLWNGIASGGNAAAFAVRNVNSQLGNMLEKEKELNAKKQYLTGIIEKDPTVPIVQNTDAPATTPTSPTTPTDSPDLAALLAADAEAQSEAVRKYFAKQGEGAFEAFIAAIEKQAALSDVSIATNLQTDETEQSDPALDYALAQYQETVDGKLAMNEAMWQAGKIGEQEYQDNLTRITREAEDDRLKIKQQKAEQVAEISYMAGNLVATLMDMELEKAGDNEEKKKEIRKKYADLNFAVTAAQIIASTAAAIMQGYAQLGPIGGTISAVLLGATGILQLGVANAQRKNVKSMATGGFAGYTAPGGKYEEAELVQLHKSEYVLPKEGTQNPQIKPILDIFEIARRNGSLARLDLRQIVQAIPAQSYSSGGFTSQPPQSPQSHQSSQSLQSPDLAELIRQNTAAMRELKNLKVFASIEDIRKADRNYTDIQNTRGL
jgi:TP901 family phage tail tape measure protein